MQYELMKEQMKEPVKFLMPRGCDWKNIRAQIKD
jgi:hypothetical protein